MPTYTLRPASDSGPNNGAPIGSGTGNWGRVDEASADDDTSYLQYTGVGEDRFRPSAASILAIKAQERIDSLIVNWRQKPGGGASSFVHRGILEVDNVSSFTPNKTQSGGGGYANQNGSFATHPSGGQQILRKNLSADLEFGVEQITVPGDLPRTRLTQVFLTVNTSAQSTLLAIKRYLSETIGDVVIPWDSPNTIRQNGTYGSKLKAWHEIVNFPAAWMIIGNESKQRKPTQSKEAIAAFIIPTVVKTDDPIDRFMELYEAVEEAIELDPSLDTLALDSTVRGFSALTTSQTIAGDFHVADIFVDVMYRHLRGDA